MFSKKLILKKTHDFCAVKEPRLTVVFIHGIASDSSSFTNALKYLEGTTSLKDIRFVAFDLLGSGQSRSDDELNYDYKEQIAALHNSIEKLKLNTPLVLVGHSMGTFIVTRYADTYKKSVKHLILVSPPIYTIEDLENPAFEKALDMFRDAVSLKNRQVLETKAFNNSLKNIVMNKKNYKVLAGIKTHATLIYGDQDAFIASYNLPKILKENPKYLTAIKTIGHHGVSREKYSKMVGILEGILNA
ncbi:alpha/beta fold hydrolase [Candidatus Saccharibacteria bacterium]|nr:alpha/beta fold hydrolase [Candidatus Saccharibacteria bacterium]